MNYADLAVVAIGRNEGERLVRCLESVAREVELVVYVDSGSSDGSVERARELGALVRELDPASPFTAARARNEGLEIALEQRPKLRFVQFVDGDCELQPGWLATAHQALKATDDVVAVCGRRRERFPERSPYNRLCDLEWDTPVGEADACGGDVMMRVEAVQRVAGYCADLIAGEDPELSHRLRRDGGRILRLDHEMTLHDADIHRFAQWWRRTRRSGHAYAECWDRHRSDRIHETEMRSILFWGLAFPLAVLLGFALIGAFGVVAPLVGYGLLFERVRRVRTARGDRPVDARLYASAVVIGKWAHAQGVLEYFWNRLRGTPAAIIEYKAG